MKQSILKWCHFPNALQLTEFPHQYRNCFIDSSFRECLYAREVVFYAFLPIYEGLNGMDFSKTWRKVNSWDLNFPRWLVRSVPKHKTNWDLNFCRFWLNGRVQRRAMKYKFIEDEVFSFNHIPCHPSLPFCYVGQWKVWVRQCRQDSYFWDDFVCFKFLLSFVTEI